jgi:hypothetical protein
MILVVAPHLSVMSSDATCAGPTGTPWLVRIVVDRLTTWGRT